MHSGRSGKPPRGWRLGTLPQAQQCPGLRDSHNQTSHRQADGSSHCSSASGRVCGVCVCAVRGCGHAGYIPWLQLPQIAGNETLPTMGMPSVSLKATAQVTTAMDANAAKRHNPGAHTEQEVQPQRNGWGDGVGRAGEGVGGGRHQGLPTHTAADGGPRGGAGTGRMRSTYNTRSTPKWYTIV
jgi:hypothetical protein